MADAFIRMLERVGLESGQAVFYAYALNTRASLIDFLNIRGIDWLFPVKNNGGGKDPREGIEKAFEEHADKAESTVDAGKTGGGSRKGRADSSQPPCFQPGI